MIDSAVSERLCTPSFSEMTSLIEGGGGGGGGGKSMRLISENFWEFWN